MKRANCPWRTDRWKLWKSFTFKNLDRERERESERKRERGEGGRKKLTKPKRDN